MKTKIKFLLRAILIALISIFVLVYCKKNSNDILKNGIPVINTIEITDITKTSAKSGGVISNDGGDTVIECGVCWSTNQNPTIFDNKTTEGSGIGSFKSDITGLNPNMTYYVRAYAANNNGIGYGNIMSFTTLEDVFNDETMIDIDGNIYKTVSIGTQTWTSENLKVTMYNDGEKIPNVTNYNDWQNLTTGAFCNYDNRQINVSLYGRMYNWNAVNTGKLCPTGWHVPSAQEWRVLENYLITNGYNYTGTTNENKIAKAMAISNGWASSKGNGTIGNSDYPEIQNSSGFSALPSGFRGIDGEFYDLGNYCGWWSSTKYFSSAAEYFSLNYNEYDLNSNNAEIEVGFSVRCVKD